MHLEAKMFVLEQGSLTQKDKWAKLHEKMLRGQQIERKEAERATVYSIRQSVKALI